MSNPDEAHRGDRDTAATSNRSKARRLRDLLAHARPVVSPGVYDGYSVRLVEAMGFSTAAITGSGLSNTRLVQPDIGIMSLLENVDACRDLARSVAIPITADADTGYGNAVTVYHTAQYFEEAGLAGINIEDQVSPKRCGHMRGKDVISLTRRLRLERAWPRKKLSRVYDKRVENAVIRYQKKNHLVPDGIARPALLTATQGKIVIDKSKFRLRAYRDDAAGRYHRC